eukprot:TRINITY_DN123_c1_g1_i1.p1 TRINITY_DN123_c1_g1~~TRINITY_DN123_c1_g1_i1.p1  ORF type:complete len:793 (+),score=306.18 TRINITY_DN123_c1_g1_i1:56-2434(+)
MKNHFTLILVISLLSISTIFCVFANAQEVDGTKLNADIKDVKVGSTTDSNAVEREEDEISSERLTSKQKDLFKSQSATHQYQAEVNQLMNIIINSLYSNTDVFLRELISNASDALDKIRFISLSNKDALKGKPELEIRIKIDAKNKMIHITDSGVGMTKEELIKNLGTIAKSGTKDFMNKLKEQKQDASSLIGQFGVGFYSSFLVADKVTVISKHYDSEKQYIWESDAGQNFFVSEDPRGNTLIRGTQITLHVKEEHYELFENEKIENLLKKFSEFIDFPIYLWKSFQEVEDIPLTEEEINKIREERKEKREKEKAEKKSEEEVEMGKDDSKEEEEEEEEKDIPKTRSEKKTVYRWELTNTNKPIWTREKSSITEEDYKSFYRALTKDTEDPQTFTHFNAEGSVNFKSILYIPKHPPSNMFEMNYKKDGLKLYVRRVFITDDFFDVLPTWLAFLKGVVDSEDMQLNVSREILQQTKSLNVLKKKIVRKAIGMMQSIAKNETEYTKFWENYSKAIKYGILQDVPNQIRLAKLLRFPSSFNTTVGAYTSLSDYVSRLKKNQTNILYLAGDNAEKLSKSPLAESALEKGYEILYLNDAIDEYAIQALRTFDAKYKFANLQKEDVKLEEDEKDEEKKEADKKRQEALDEQFKELKTFLKEKLAGKISRVTLSERLTKSPAALVAATYGMSANMERILKAQALGNTGISKSNPSLEVNPNHPLITELNNKIAIEGKDSPLIADVAELLYHTSALLSGYPVDEPGLFAESIHNLLNSVMGIESKSSPTPSTTESHDEL